MKTTFGLGLILFAFLASAQPALAPEAKAYVDAEFLGRPENLAKLPELSLDCVTGFARSTETEYRYIADECGATPQVEPAPATIAAGSARLPTHLFVAIKFAQESVWARSWALPLSEFSSMNSKIADVVDEIRYNWAPQGCARWDEFCVLEPVRFYLRQRMSDSNFLLESYLAIKTAIGEAKLKQFVATAVNREGLAYMALVATKVAEDFAGRGAYRPDLRDAILCQLQEGLNCSEVSFSSLTATEEVGGLETFTFGFIYRRLHLDRSNLSDTEKATLAGTWAWIFGDLASL